MRMRRKKHGPERIAACSEYLICPDRDMPGVLHDPSEWFPDRRPVFLEIGCGKGGFAASYAASHPECNLIAVERVPDVACLALEKAKAGRGERQSDNLRILIANAQDLTGLFCEHSFAGIFLNFSDPWPKKGYAKRRLTHRLFLEQYRRLLSDHGLLYFKTDNEPLFDFSLDEFAAADLSVEQISRDLHEDTSIKDNIMTEYESNFVSQGKPIYYARVRFEKDYAGTTD